MPHPQRARQRQRVRNNFHPLCQCQPPRQGRHRRHRSEVQVCHRTDSCLKDVEGANFCLRAFSDSLVEVRNDRETDSIRIAVFSHSAKKKREIAQMTAKTDSPGPSGRSGKPPRPPNSFILYRQHHHAGMVAKHPGLHNNQICAYWFRIFADISDSS